MATLFEVLKNARMASQTARGVVVGIIEDHDDVITKYNKDQLIHGFDRDMDKLSPYRSLLYSLEKQKQNPLAGLGNPDLNLTGAFYRGFFITVSGMSFEISSNDSKTGDLKSKYGEWIFGLSNNSMAMYTRNEFFKEFKSFIENTLKLKLK